MQWAVAAVCGGLCIRALELATGTEIFGISRWMGKGNSGPHAKAASTSSRNSVPNGRKVSCTLFLNPDASQSNKSGKQHLEAIQELPLASSVVVVLPQPDYVKSMAKSAVKRQEEVRSLHSKLVRQTKGKGFERSWERMHQEKKLKLVQTLVSELDGSVQHFKAADFHVHDICPELHVRRLCAREGEGALDLLKTVLSQKRSIPVMELTDVKPQDAILESQKQTQQIHDEVKEFVKAFRRLCISSFFLQLLSRHNHPDFGERECVSEALTAVLKAAIGATLLMAVVYAQHSGYIGWKIV